MTQVNNQSLKEFFDTACQAAFGTDASGELQLAGIQIQSSVRQPLRLVSAFRGLCVYSMQ